MSTAIADDRGVITECPSCHQKNRVAFSRLEEPTRCGRCKTELPHVGAPVDVTTAAEFDSLLSTSSLPVVVDFWAPWCGPCKMVAPELQKVAARQAGKLLVVKVNTDEVDGLGDRLGIRSIPTMAVFKSGREVGRTSGARPASDIEAFVSNALR
jgi:thioredoxin 2